LYLCCSVYCLRVNVYCTTAQLQLTNMSYHINENQFRAKFMHMLSSCECTFSAGGFSLMDSQYTRHIYVVTSCVMQQVTYDVLSKSFRFCLHILNRAHIGLIHTIFEVIPNNITTGIMSIGTYKDQSINKKKSYYFRRISLWAMRLIKVSA
jgi:hypothetical protein